MVSASASLRNQSARRALACVICALSLLGFCAIVVALSSEKWSVYAADDGSGLFGLWKYHFTIRNVTREGDVMSHSPTALCNLDFYNATRARENQHLSVRYWRDDCDAMVNAVGLSKSLGCLAAAFSLLSACLCMVSAILPKDNPTQGAHCISYKPKICPRYSTLALVCTGVASVLSLLVVWAYATERPDKPNYFLKDYDTPGSKRSWHLGSAYWFMLAGAGAMLSSAISLFVYSKRFLTSTGPYDAAPSDEKEVSRFETVVQDEDDSEGGMALL